MRIRAATEDDSDALARVHVESWRSTYRGLVPDDFLAALSVENGAETWRRLIGETGPDRGVLVLEDDVEVIGFCHYGPNRDGAASTTGEVTSIYLVADRWQRGGGTRLLDTALSAMASAGYTKASLWVLDGNVRARAFYQARSWVHDGAAKVDDRGLFQLRELRYVRSRDR